MILICCCYSDVLIVSNKVILVLNSASQHEGVWRSRGTASCTRVELGGQSRALTALCLGKENQVSLKAGWAPELDSTLGEEEHLFPMVGIEPQFLGHPVYS